MEYDKKYMRFSGPWYRLRCPDEHKPGMGCFPVIRQETDFIYNQHSSKIKVCDVFVVYVFCPTTPNVHPCPTHINTLVSAKHQ